MDETCTKCGGTGMMPVVNSAGHTAVRECECQASLRSSRRISASHIPPRYQHCSFENLEPNYPNAHPSLLKGLLAAQAFVREYPVGTDGRGLLLTGTIGVGKTHLAVGALKVLIQEKGARGLFCDYRELLKEIQHSYNPQVNSTELDVLRPVFNAEVLVLDELGAQKPTEWVWDTVALILNTRYNEKKTTIITSNYANLAPGASKEDTLGDRIGERMRSRLAEMCGAIVMTGKDFRQVKSASYVLA